MLDSVNEIAIPSQAVEKIQDNQNSILQYGATFNQLILIRLIQLQKNVWSKLIINRI